MKIVVGGTLSISDTVNASLQSIAPTVICIGGADRYEVSRNVVGYAFLDRDGAVPASRIYLATGQKFPGALSASAAAGALHGAVLLVEGASLSIDQPTQDLLTRTDPGTVAVVGGSASVTNRLIASVRDAGPSGFRIGGRDRYEVSRNVNLDAFRGTFTVYVASGEKFADALVAGARAGCFSAPVYLVPGTCVTTETSMDIRSFTPASIILVGGPESLRPAVEALTSCE